MNKNSLFGKAVEHYIISLMCRKGLDCYVPVNDDKGIDVIVRGESGKTVPVQIKSTSPDIKVGDAGFFVVKKNQTVHDNCFFVFYSARMNEIWLMTKDELSSFGSINTKGKHIGASQSGSTARRKARSMFFLSLRNSPRVISQGLPKP